MSLIADMMTPCARLVPTQTPDGRGGRAVRWDEGETFDAAVIRPKPSAVREGQRANEAARLTVVTDRATALGFGDVFRRLSDGGVFRVVSRGADAVAPEGSAAPIARAECERWVLP